MRKAVVLLVDGPVSSNLDGTSQKHYLAETDWCLGAVATKVTAYLLCRQHAAGAFCGVTGEWSVDGTTWASFGIGKEIMPVAALAVGSRASAVFPTAANPGDLKLFGPKLRIAFGIQNGGGGGTPGLATADVLCKLVFHFD